MKHLFRYLLAMVVAVFTSLSAFAYEYPSYGNIDWKNYMCLGWGAYDPKECDPSDDYCIKPIGRVEAPISYSDLLNGVPESISAYLYLRKSAVHVSMSIHNDTVLSIGISPEEDYTVPWTIYAKENRCAAIISDHTKGGDMSRIKEVWYYISGSNEININNSKSTSENYGFWHLGARVYMTFAPGASLKLNCSGGSEFVAVSAHQILHIDGYNYTFTTNGAIKCDGDIYINGAKEVRIQYSKDSNPIEADGTLRIYNSTVNVVSTKNGIWSSLGSTIKDSYVKVTGPAANGALRGPLTMTGCSIISPEGAAYNSSLFGVAANGSLVKTVTIEPDGYAIYVKGAQVTRYSATHSSEYSYNDNTKTLTLKSDIITDKDTAIYVGMDNLTIVSDKDSLVVRGKTRGILFNGQGTLNIYSKNSGAVKIGTIITSQAGNGIGIHMAKASVSNLTLGKGRFYIEGSYIGVNGGNFKTEGTSFLNVLGNFGHATRQLQSFNPYGLVVKSSSPSGATSVVLNNGQLYNQSGTELWGVTFGPKNYNLWIMGTQVTSVNCDHLETLDGILAGGAGQISYSEEDNKLTISKVTYMNVNSATYAIRSAIPDLTIEFTGQYTVITGYQNVLTSGGYSCIRLDKNTTITGDAEVVLNAKYDGYGLYLCADATNYANSDLTVTLKDINLKTTGMMGIGGVSNNWENHGAVVSFDNATVSATANGHKTSGNPGASIGNLHDLTIVKRSCHIVQPTDTILWFYADSAAVVEQLPGSSDVIRRRKEVKIEPSSFSLWVGGTQVTGGNYQNITGDGINGNASFDPGSLNLTLNNFQYVGSDEGIKTQLSGGLISSTLGITLHGDNSIVTSKDGILSNDHIHIHGDGTLFVRVTGTDADAVEMAKARDLTIDEGVTVIFESTKAAALKGYGSRYLTIDSATVKATGKTGSIVKWGAMRMQGGVAVISPSGAAFNSSLKGVALDGELVTSTVEVSRPVNYNLRINGQYVTNQNCWNIANYISGITKVNAAAESTLTYSAETKTLTMQNVKLTTSDVTWGIFNQIQGLKIEVMDTCIVYAPYCIALRTDRNLTIMGGNSNACLKVLNDGPLPRQIGSVAAGTAYAAFTSFSNANITIENCSVEVAGAGGVKMQGNSLLMLDSVHMTAQTVGTPQTDAQRAVMVSFYAGIEPMLQNCELIAPEGAVYSSTLHGYTTDNVALTTEMVEIGYEMPEQECNIGFLPGRFSVAAGKQVGFTKGNLQYQASTDTWRYAEHQWDRVGDDNANISPTYSGWIDLFGWGTAENPTNASTHPGDYPTYNPYVNNFVDWGVNPISNGCNTGNEGRTPKEEEWEYLLNTRPNAALLKGTAKVNGVNGFVFLPDAWVAPEGIVFTPMPGDYSTNVYTVAEWQQLEEAGAVFFPAAGLRRGTSVVNVGWTAYMMSDSPGSCLLLSDSYTHNTAGDLAYDAKSVRLVRDLENNCSAEIRTEFSATACDSYTWAGKTYTESGNYENYFITPAGCDSIVTLHLTINKSVATEFSETACDSYTWQGETYTASGDYEKTFPMASGCDSIVTLHLTILKSVATEFSETACDSYTWQGETYTASGDYEKTFQMTSGCDSLVTLHLTIMKSVATEFNATECDSYTWLGETYTESGNYERHLTTAAGCDSLVTLHLTILNSTSAEVTELAEGSFSWNGKTYTESGNYTDTIVNAAGCDSIVTLHLTIFKYEENPQDVYYRFNTTTDEKTAFAPVVGEGPELLANGPVGQILKKDGTFYSYLNAECKYVGPLGVGVTLPVSASIDNPAHIYVVGVVAANTNAIRNVKLYKAGVADNLGSKYVTNGTAMIDFVVTEPGLYTISDFHISEVRVLYENNSTWQALMNMNEVHLTGETTLSDTLTSSFFQMRGYWELSADGGWQYNQDFVGGNLNGIFFTPLVDGKLEVVAHKRSTLSSPYSITIDTVDYYDGNYNMIHQIGQIEYHGLPNTEETFTFERLLKKGATYKLSGHSMVISSARFIPEVEPQPAGILTWRADDEDIKDLGTISQNTTVRGLTFVADASNTIVVDASNKTYDTLSFTHRIKLGGTMKADSRHLRFNVKGDTKVEIYCMSSSSSAERVMNLAVDTFNNTVKQFEGINGSGINYCTYDYQGGPATLFIGSNNSGINIYGISITGDWIQDNPPCENKYSEFFESAEGSYTWNSETYTTSGDYEQTFPMASGCDSIVTLHLTITEPVVEQKWENGILPGKFSIAEDKQVQFSQGNLQYKASADVWQFAATQYSVVGYGNANISPTYNDWIDLFGWGTGNNPTLTTENADDYTNFVDWGVNAISNGGNQPNMWHSITWDEWIYLLYTRPNAQRLVALGTVNGRAGAILLPDDWTLPEGLSFSSAADKHYQWQTRYYYASTNGYQDNVYTAEQWATMEAAGAVFLPVAGRRNGTSYYTDGAAGANGIGEGRYWTSTTTTDGLHSYNVIQPGHLGLFGSSVAYTAVSVRLVKDVEETPIPVEYEVSYVCDFTTKASKHNAYYDSWVYDNAWTIFGGSNYNASWAYCKFGGKNTTLENANPVYIANISPFAKDIKLVKVYINKGPISGMTVNSWGVETYNDPAFSESTRLGTVYGTEITGTDTITIAVSSEAAFLWEAGVYFRVYWDLSNTTSTNGIIWIDKVEFLTQKNGPGTAEEDIRIELLPRKIIRNDKVIIIMPDGTEYSVLGKKIR